MQPTSLETSNSHPYKAAHAGSIFVAVILTLATFLGTARAQSGAGSIQGTVQDQTGAAIPNAAVHVVNQQTRATVDTKANASGFYSVPSLFAGSYTLTFSAPGMKNFATSLNLQVAQNAVISPKLSPGAVTETVTVTGNAAQLADYADPTISSTLDNARINQLPENGRNILTLIQETTPGIEGGGTRVNGNEVAGVEYVQDGAPLSNRNGGGPTTQPDPDAVQEVRLETTNSNAEFAEPATAVLTTKSGTDQFHGSYFETARNNAIGIAKSRSDPFNLVAPHLVRNEFGASIGGPVILPKLYNGKDKTFFFVAYERYSNRQTVNENDTVPTAAMRMGDFSQLESSSGLPQVLYDPSTTQSAANNYQRTPFNYGGPPSCTAAATATCTNKIDPSRISPLAQALYAITPVPTNAANPGRSSNYTAPGLSDTTRPTLTARVDQIFNENNRIFLRYTDDSTTNLNLRTATTAQLPNTLPSALLGPESTNFQTTPIHLLSAAFGYTHVFSSSFVSQLTVGNEWENDNVEGGGDTQTNYEQLLGLPNNFGEVGFPQIGTSNLYTYYQGSQYNYDSSQILTNIDEDLTKTLKNHQLFFGGRYRHEHLGVLPDRAPDSVAFNGNQTSDYNIASGANYTGVPNTGNANADFFLGAASTYSVTLNPPYYHYHDQEFDAYFQDDYHASPKLTLNLGLRWEAHPAPIEDHNAVNGFDLANHAVVLGEPIPDMIARRVTTQAIITNLENLGVVFETPQEAGLPPHLVNSYDTIFNPRLGFAYSPFKSGGGTVIRGGYGRYVYPIPLRNFYSIVRQDAPTSASYSQSYTAANQSPDGLPNYDLRAPQTVVAGLNSAGVVNTNQINSILPGISETVLNPRYPPNLVQQLNFTVEQPIKGNQVLRVSYIYNHGTNLDQLNYHNQAESTYVWEATTGTVPPTGTYASVALNPYDNHTYGVVTTDDRNGFSTDNALQINFQRLYKSGVAYQAFYTYSSAFRVGGNTFRDSAIYPYADYAPGVAPTSDPTGLNYFENYEIDSAIPRHHIGFNFIYDLPFGTGKKFLGHTGRFVNELIGGYQIAGDGNIVSQYFQVSASNWGQTNPIQSYKKTAPITDCSSGVCLKGNLWFNGYISPVILGKGLITGIPSNYVPYEVPINYSNPTSSNYLTNNVSVGLNNGKTVVVGYAPGPSADNYAGANRFSHTFLSGPFIFAPDLSIFKVFPITERVILRINADFFNAFNIQGLQNPNTTTGEQLFTASQNTPRQLQLTARLTF